MGGGVFFSFNNQEMPARVPWQDMSMQVVPWIMQMRVSRDLVLFLQQADNQPYPLAGR